MRPARIVAIEGASGVGKTRLARLLSEALPRSVYLAEAYDRLDSPPSLAVPDRRALWRVERTLLREERRRYREARRIRSDGSSVILDTGVLGPLTYAWGLGRIDPRRALGRPMRQAYLRSASAGTLGMPDLTIYLSAGARTVRDRVARDLRRTPADFRERHAEVAEGERSLWTGPIGSVLGGRFLVVDAGPPPPVVLGRLVRATTVAEAAEGLSLPSAGRLLTEALDAIPPDRVTVKKRTRRPPTPRR